MVTRWRIWIRNRPESTWYDPVLDANGGDGSWTSREDAEATAQQFRIRAAAMTPQDVAKHLGISVDEVAPVDLQAIVLPNGELPDPAMRVQTLPSGEQVPTGRL